MTLGHIFRRLIVKSWSIREGVELRNYEGIQKNGSRRQNNDDNNGYYDNYEDTWIRRNTHHHHEYSTKA